MKGVHVLYTDLLFAIIGKGSSMLWCTTYTVANLNLIIVIVFLR